MKTEAETVVEAETDGTDRTLMVRVERGRVITVVIVITSSAAFVVRRVSVSTTSVGIAERLKLTSQASSRQVEFWTTETSVKVSTKVKEPETTERVKTSVEVMMAPKPVSESLALAAEVTS